MEAQIGSENLNHCVGGTSNGTERRPSLDWNLNDYNWNGNLFLASQINPSPSKCTHKQLFNSQSTERDKRRRISSPIEQEIETEDQDEEERNELDERMINNETGINLDRPICQVDGCGADLTVERDYHRRHKVCANHSKARSAAINGEIKRFCQQCSKFHNMEEFDEGKRSCRRRLDRHNGRRRKKNNQNATDNLLNGNQANAIIITLLKIITNLESARQDTQTDQQILNISALLQRLQQNDQNAPDSNNLNNLNEIPSSSNSMPKSGGVRNFDLNDEYFEQETENENENENQGRTGKIVFKLFGKDPSDSPPNLRPEILTWLSNCPSEMESYIKPGCIVLTLYLRLNNSKWQHLVRNLGYYIERLIHINPNFWGTGFVYATLEDQVLFLHNGRIILEGPLIFEDQNRIKIVNVNPIAVPFDSKVTFCVKGFNFSKSNARLFCVFDGKCLVQKSVRDLLLKDENTVNGGAECLTFSCSVPACTGRGFIEIEEFDHSGFSFPFLITDSASCIEIRALESENNLIQSAHDFLQELGWLLNRARLRSAAPVHSAAFRAARFKHLVYFALDKEWCNVLNTLLDLLFEGPNGEEFVLSEDFLFEAVRRKSKKLVDFLLKYKIKDEGFNERYVFVPDMEKNIKNDENDNNNNNNNNNNGLFVTPIHLAASLDGMESVLDALTDDPQKIGIKAWSCCRSTNGTNQTPKELAQQKGQLSYLQLVQSKIDSSKKSMHLMPAPKHHFDLEKGLQNCRLCENRTNKFIRRSTVNRVLGNRAMVLSVVCVAAVCVCVALILKTPPFVRFTKPPFLWDSLKGGPM